MGLPFQCHWKRLQVFRLCPDMSTQPIGVGLSLARDDRAFVWVFWYTVHDRSSTDAVNLGSARPFGKRPWKSSKYKTMAAVYSSILQAFENPLAE